MKILVSGASIAGPATAFFLLQHGFDVTVVERAPTRRLGGYAIDVRGAALDVLEQMGLREALRPLETNTLSNAVVDARGRRFGRMARGFGVIDEGDIEVLRGDLASVLHGATRGAFYRFGDSIARIEPRADGVSVTFASGGRAEYDVVIGADGVHSRTRDCAFGAESCFVRELGGAMAIFTVPNMIGLDREQLVFSGIRRIASIKASNDNSELKVCVFFPVEPGELDHRDEGAQRELVARAFEDQGWEFPRFVGAMRAAEDFYCDVTCQVHMDRYHEGRVALVGDAAFCPSPLSGQGTSLALVGACILGRALGRWPNDPVRAFAEYDVAMRPFATRNQAIAMKLADAFAPRSPFQVWSRNLAMRVLPYVPGKTLVVKLAMRDIAAAARDVTLV